jgi:site-specific DNA-cytosine methylase
MVFTYLEVCGGCGGLSYGLDKSGLIPHTLIEITPFSMKNGTVKCLKE